MDAEALRDGLLAMNTTRFGRVAEIMIRRLESLQWAADLAHDLVDDDGKRVEVKFSWARRKHDTVVTEDTVLACIASAPTEDRPVRYDERSTARFDCNIQQIKRDQFHVLYYGVFFYDRVLVFRLASAKIPEAGVGYSDKQHRGNLGEGQFHITKKTIAHHEANYLRRELTYDDLLALLSQ